MEAKHPTKLTIFHKFLFIMLFAIVFPAIIVHSVQVSSLLGQVDWEQQNLISALSQLLSVHVRTALGSVVNTSFSIICDSTIKDFLLTDQVNPAYPYRYTAAQESLLNYMLSNSYVDEIIISDIGGEKTLNSNFHQRYSFSPQELELLSGSSGTWFWSQDETEVSMIRLIRDTSDPTKEVGYLKLVLDQAEIKNQIVEVYPHLNADYAFYNSRVGVLFSSVSPDQDEAIESYFLTHEAPYPVADTCNDLALSILRLDDHSTYLILMSVRPSSQMKYARYAPVFMFLAVFVAIATLLTHLYNKEIIQPINALRAEIGAFAQGKTDGRLNNIQAKAEVAELINAYRRLTNNIDQLYRLNYAKEIELRDSKLLMLSSSMNPHFFNNTMDSIRWMIELDRKDNALDMIDQLAGMFRLSTLLSEQSYIPLSQEIELAEKYIAIEKYRFGDLIQVHWDVAPGLAGQMVLKFIIQPLVENSINHGLMKTKGHGTVWVRIYAQGNTLIYDIQDDGIGADLARIEGILANQIEKKHSLEGFALYNIHSRIRVYCGEENGLRYTLREDGGSRVIVTQNMSGLPREDR